MVFVFFGGIDRSRRRYTKKLFLLVFLLLTVLNCYKPEYRIYKYYKRQLDSFSFEMLNSGVYFY